MMLISRLHIKVSEFITKDFHKAGFIEEVRVAIDQYLSKNSKHLVIKVGRNLIVTNNHLYCRPLMRNTSR